MRLYSSPVGKIYSVFEDEFLVEVSINDKPLLASIDSLSAVGLQAAGNSFGEELDTYFKGSSVSFGQKVMFVKGTPFEQKVWLALKKIPSGETRTYKWIAEQVGSPKAVRAVGQALGKNPLPLILPCHRVIASDGSLGGYSGGGVKVKAWLLKHEGAFVRKVRRVLRN